MTFRNSSNFSIYFDTFFINNNCGNATNTSIRTSVDTKSGTLNDLFWTGSSWSIGGTFAIQSPRKSILNTSYSTSLQTRLVSPYEVRY